MAAIHTAAGAAIHISTARRRPRIRSAHLPDPAFRHGYVGSTSADWQSTCAILSTTTPTPTPTPTLDLHDLVRITDLSPAPKHGSTLRVAYKGSEAAAAAKAYPDCDAVPCDQFEVAFLAVELWIADRAVVPIEDSLGGSVSRNLDLLLRHRLHIVGEVQLPHHHQWRNQKFELGWTGIDWVGLECEMTNKKKENIQKNTKKQNFGVDCSQPQPNLASSLDHHCLLALPGVHQDCLADGIQDDSGNVTRFVMLAREPVVPRTDRPFKTSIVFAHDRGGTSPLFKVLSAFAFRGISLTKIESRPHRNRNRPDVGTGKQFEYIFYLDFQASMAEPRAQNALAVIQEFTSFLRVLGSYPMDMTPWGPAATSPSSSSSSSAAD